MADPTPASFRLTLRLLCAALIGSQVVLLLAVSGILGPDGFDTPPVWALVLVGAIGVAEALAIPALGYRVPAIAPGTSEAETSRAVVTAVQSSTIVRFALSEAVSLASLAIGIAVHDGGAIVCLVGVGISVSLGTLHVWPSTRVLGRLKDALEREGGQSYLDAVMDAPPPSRRG